MIETQDQDEQTGQQFLGGRKYDAFLPDERDVVVHVESERGYRKEILKEEPFFLVAIYLRTKKVVWDFTSDERSSRAARIWWIFIFLVIILSVVIFIVQSWPSYYSDQRQTKWFLIETAIVAIFTVEYVARLLSAPDPLEFATQFLSIIDLLSILPYFLTLIITTVFSSGVSVGWLSFIRVIRLARIFRLFKFGRLLPKFQAFADSMWYSGRESFPLFFLLICGMILASSLLYFAELTECRYDDDSEQWFYDDDSSDPGKLSPFQSIPHTLWWAIVTMTTVGYGDTFPITPTGKLVAALTMPLGILVCLHILLAPVGVLSTKFQESLVAYDEMDETNSFVKINTDYVVDRKLEILEELLEELEEQVDATNFHFSKISSRHIAMAKKTEQLLTDYYAGS